MKKFNDFLLNEAAGANTHMDHPQDMIFLYGTDGLRDAINFFRGVRDMLAGNTSGKYNMTVKWDGAPAVFCGTDPENGKFFVATKSLFNKTPKVNYSIADIRKNHPGGAGEKLQVAFEYLKDLNIKNVLQGDMMFSKSDLESTTIDGESYVTFQPNTIVYAVPQDTDLAKELRRAEMGIVFHTTYTGSTLRDLSAKFGANTRVLRKSSKVWIHDAKLQDVSGTASLTKSETAVVTSILSRIGKNFQKLNAGFINGIATQRGSNDFRQLALIYTNAKIRKGQLIGNPKKHFDDMIDWISERFQKEMDKVKTDVAKERKAAVRDEMIKYLNNNKQQLILAFSIQDDIQVVRDMLVRKLERVQGMTRTFVAGSDGYRVVAPEGFVAISHEKGNAIKLVDQLVFSANNFNTELKKWGK